MYVDNITMPIPDRNTYKRTDMCNNNLPNSYRISEFGLNSAREHFFHWASSDELKSHTIRKLNYFRALANISNELLLWL